MAILGLTRKVFTQRSSKAYVRKETYPENTRSINTEEQNGGDSINTHAHNAHPEQNLTSRVCPMHENWVCIGPRCAWFSHYDDACAVLAIAKVLSSIEEWERDRS